MIPSDIEISPDYYYINTLEYYLKYSDEDYIDAKLIAEFICKNNLFDEKYLNWLDVGIGPGTKLIMVLDDLVRKRVNIPSISYIEPSANWCKFVAKSLKSANYYDFIKRVYSVKWENFNIHSLKTKNRLLSFMHSLYGITTNANRIFENFASIPEMLDVNGWLCLIIESPQSDLFQIKQFVFEKIGWELKSYINIEKTFEYYNWDYLKPIDAPQKFYLPHNILLEKLTSEDINALSFICQLSPADFRKHVPTKLKKEIITRLGQKVKKNNKGYFINVPDRIYWSKCRQKKN